MQEYTELSIINTGELAGIYGIPQNITKDWPVFK